MELQFSKEAFRCLRTVVQTQQTKEETQEIRISDGLPDIGKVIGCWGQALTRGKEWRTDEIRINGGVMVWVAYAPEDGSGIRCVETWIPMQLRWDLEDSQRDGQICITPLLTCADARSTSARKLMVRVCVSIAAEALEESQQYLCKPDKLPEDIQLLRRTYPVELPQEAGEKLFQLEETVQLPAESVRPEKILHYSLIPTIIEHKILANRLVFRGSADLHMLYIGTDGQLHTFEYAFAFSQFAELDRDCGSAATAWIVPILTSLELTRSQEDTVSLNAGIAAQYVIYDRQILELTEDAYSNLRTVEPMYEMLALPSCLDRRTLEAELTAQLPQGPLAEVCWLPEQPVITNENDTAKLCFAGQYQFLYYDEEGKLQADSGRAETVVEMPSAAENTLKLCICSEMDEAKNCRIRAQVATTTGAAMSAVSGLQAGECREPDPNRPSMVLCKNQGEGLWQIAKRHCSTVEQIMAANGLTDEPKDDKMLLIPVK